MPTEGRGRTEQPVKPAHAGSLIPMSAHLVGVCGSGMRALAELLDGMGWRLSGSDLQPATAAIESLTQQSLLFHQGHAAAHVPEETQCLVYSPAVGADNPERIEATRRGLPQWSYSQMIGQLMAGRVGIGIAGTHGKSTTTAMVGWILTRAGRDPAVLVGAELCDTARSGWSGNGDLFVVESCEFQRSFLDFQPRHAAILSVEPDHFDCYPDLDSLVRAFADFARQLPEDGVLIVNGDCPASRDAVRDAVARIGTFGSTSDCDWQAEDIRHVPGGTSFRLVRRGRQCGSVSLRLHGDHNVQNALAAAALCVEIGVSVDEVVAGLQTFGGIGRRFEVIGDWNGVTCIDDYAHHPTAIRATLRTARQVFGARRIWCLFQPHQVSRTLALMDDFAASFSDADDVWITPVFAARERLADEPLRVSQELTRRIAARGQSVRFMESLDRIAATVQDAARPGDVLIAMGAGDIDRIHHEFTRRIC